MRPSRWCACCGERIALGIVTAGGVIFHLACWRRRVAILTRCLGTGTDSPTGP